jgi:hypothetical protein
METWELQEKLPVFLTWVVGEGQLSASRSVYIPGKYVRCIRCLCGRMGARVDLPAVENKKATPTGNLTVVIRSYSPYCKVEILRKCWLQLRCVFSACKYRQRRIVATGGTRISQRDNGLSKEIVEIINVIYRSWPYSTVLMTKKYLNFIIVHFLCLFIFLLTALKTWP